MEDLRSALRDHADVVSEIFEKFSTELRRGFRPAYDNFVGFFHAINWKWMVVLLLNFTISGTGIVYLLSMCNGALADRLNFVPCNTAADCRYFKEKCQFSTCPVNSGMWKNFAGQNYFDPHGIFISVLWSGPLLFISIVIVVNTLITTCQLIIRWKRAELRHRAKIARNKED